MSKRRRGRRARQAGWNTVGLAVFAVMVFPVFWMISTALKSNEQIVSLNPTWFPLHPTLSHFRDAMNRPFFWVDVKNSLIVVTVTVAISMLLAFFAALALAKYRFAGRSLFLVMVIGIQMLPQAGLIIPLYVVLARYHQVNVLSGVIITYMTFVLPFSIWMLRGFIVGIPRELEEAATLDGASSLQRLRLVFLPLAAPAVGITSVFIFIYCWNEFVLAMTLLRSNEKYTLTMQIFSLVGGRYQVEWDHVMGATLVASVPVAIVFAMLQRYLVSGLTVGAVK
jgi:ABC-type glycerol-3-phosphate transport system permease component